MSPVDFVLWIMAMIVGGVVSSIIIGLMTDKFVIKRIMQNEDVKDIILLFREGKEHLRQLLENQKKKPQ